MPIIQREYLSRIKQIHKLSKSYNKHINHNHKDKLLKLMQEHVDEIRDLYEKGDTHFLTETGDLIILCFELLLEHNISLDETLLKCFTRYETKLGRLVKEQENNAI